MLEDGLLAFWIDLKCRRSEGTVEKMFERHTKTKLRGLWSSLECPKHIKLHKIGFHKKNTDVAKSSSRKLCWVFYYIFYRMDP